MESGIHSLASLFDQLGLDSSEEAIRLFITENSLSEGQLIHEASFWSTSQACFLRQALENDADWSELVDQLALLLRSA